jgi:hypothetical protein
MNRESYKTKRKGQPKRKSPFTRAKSQMLAKPKAISQTSKLSEIYATKIEWATKRMPKLKQ